jgi:hypothetical protein
MEEGEQTITLSEEESGERLQPVAAHNIDECIA